MLIEDGYEICRNSINIKFSELFNDIYETHQDILFDIRKNKGKVGQMMEKKCGLKLNNNTTDFDNGDLKTMKMGKVSRESSFFLIMIKSWIDEMLKEEILPFEKTLLHKKTKKFILMHVNKDDKNELNWFFRKCSLYDSAKGTLLFKKLESDYIAICKELKRNLRDPSQVVHTTNGNKDSIIQIRTKGAGKGKDKSIYSNVLNREITKNTTLAFYMKRINFLEFNNEKSTYE